MVPIGPKDVITGAPQPRFPGPALTGAQVCPCIREERPMCREGKNCWHFDGKSKGTCDHCHNTGRIFPVRD